MFIVVYCSLLYVVMFYPYPYKYVMTNVDNLMKIISSSYVRL